MDQFSSFVNSSVHNTSVNFHTNNVYNTDSNVNTSVTFHNNNVYNTDSYVNTSDSDTCLDAVFNRIPCHVMSPINVPLLDNLLSTHPDRGLVSFLVDGFNHGFSIGFTGPMSTGQSRNLLSARNNPSAVTAAIKKELIRQHTSGPFDSIPFHPFHCSSLGAVPKKDGSYRIILDLSSPRGSSINEGIPQELYAVKYSSFDDAVDLVAKLGPSTFMAKLDIKHAFRLCPVRPCDWPLLGYMWQEQFYFDTRLPFGSRSSPYIFNAFAEALLWILMYIYGVPNLLHYLDDFFVCALERSSCARHMETVKSVFSSLGVPLAPEKIVGPTQTITYLGIEIDSLKQTIQLPADKLTDLLSMLQSWEHKKKCTKRELLSLIGSLSFACKVIKPGRMFLRRLIDLSTTVQNLNHHIMLNQEARADITWWVQFMPTWNGKENIQAAPITSVALRLFTDASDKGFGAVFQTHWLCSTWPDQLSHYHINFKELFAVLACVFTWGVQWRDKQILLYTDNLTIVHV